MTAALCKQPSPNNALQANGGIASLLQATRFVAVVAELGSLGWQESAHPKTSRENLTHLDPPLSACIEPDAIRRTYNALSAEVNW